MMKKYEELEISVVKFMAMDVLTASGEQSLDNEWSDPLANRDANGGV